MLSDPPTIPRYAGFWRRLLAFAIDYIVLAILLSLVLKVLISDASSTSTYAMEGNESVIARGAALIVFWLYFTGWESSALQATPGKVALGIQVTDVAGNRMSLSQASIRTFSKFISFFLLFYGFIKIAFHPQKQGSHDVVASSFVVVRAKA